MKHFVNLLLQVTMLVVACNVSNALIIANSFRNFTGPMFDVESIALYDDYLFAGSADRYVYMWQISTGQLLNTFDGHTSNIINVFVAGQILISQDYNTIIQRNYTSGAILYQYNLQALCLTLNGSSLVSLTPGGQIQAYSLQSYQLLTQPSGHLPSCPYISGSYMYTRGTNGADLDQYASNGSLINQFKFPSTLTGYILSNSGYNNPAILIDQGIMYVGANYGNGAIIAWFPDGHTSYAFVPTGIRNIVVSGTSLFVASSTYAQASTIGIFYEYDATSLSLLNTYYGHPDWVNEFGVSGQWLFSGSSDGSVRMWLRFLCNPGFGLNSNNTACEACPVGTYKNDSSYTGCSPCPSNATCTATSMTCNPGFQLNYYATGCDLITLGTNSPVYGASVIGSARSFYGPTNTITSLTVVGDYLFAASRDHNVYMWNITSGVLLSSFGGQSFPATCVVANEVYVFSGAEDGTIMRTNYLTGVGSSYVTASAVMGLALNGSYLYAADAGANLYQWNWTTSQLLHQWKSTFPNSGIGWVKQNCLTMNGTTLFAGTEVGIFQYELDTNSTPYYSKGYHYDIKFGYFRNNVPQLQSLAVSAAGTFAGLISSDGTQLIVRWQNQTRYNLAKLPSAVGPIVVKGFKVFTICGYSQLYVLDFTYDPPKVMLYSTPQPQFFRSALTLSGSWIFANEYFNSQNIVRQWYPFSCDPGFGLTLDQSNCTACPQNTYKANATYSPCLPCPQNAVCNTTSFMCNPGFGVTVNGTGCDVCGGSLYQPTETTGRCLSCPQNATCNATSFTCNPGFAMNANFTGCDACPGISYQPTQTSGLCLSCPQNATCNGTSFTCNPSFGVNVNRTGCDPCSGGTYQPTETSGRCLSCPQNAICNSTTFTCNPGFIMNVSRAGCDACPGGTYQPVPTSGLCVSCPQNAICNATSFACNPGFTLNVNHSGCDACPGGSYKPTYSNGQCLTCPQNATCNATSFTCNPSFGLNVDRTGCDVCGGASYQPTPTSGLCIPCPQNAVCNVTSFMCNPGFGISANRTGCDACGGTSYQPTGIIGRCLSCPPDTTCNATAFTCNPGFIMNVNFTGCDACPAGTYQPTPSSGLCLPCPQNATCNATVFACNPGFGVNVNRTGCNACPGGTYQPTPSSGLCLPCPQNATCNATMFACNPGFGVNVNRIGCDACPGGTYQLTQTMGSCLLCPQHASCDGTHITCNPGFTFKSSTKECMSGTASSSSSNDNLTWLYTVICILLSALMIN